MSGVFFAVSYARLDLSLPIWMIHTASYCHRTVMGQYIAIYGIERGIVDVRSEDALLQVIQDHHPCDAAQPAERFFMQLRPDLRTGTELQQPHRFSAIA